MAGNVVVLLQQPRVVLFSGFFRATTSRRKQNTAGFRIRKARFLRYL